MKLSGEYSIAEVGVAAARAAYFDEQLGAADGDAVIPSGPGRNDAANSGEVAL